MGVGAGRGGWGAGLRFVPPKAEAERQGLLLMRRSKKRASEQRDDFFGHRKAARSAIVRWRDGNPGHRERAWETIFPGKTPNGWGGKCGKPAGRGGFWGIYAGKSDHGLWKTV